MRIYEIEQREDYPSILRQTLTDGLSVQFGKPVTAKADGKGQVWRQHRFFSAVVGPHPSSRVRKFLTGSMQWTPRRTRTLPQYVASHLLAYPRPFHFSSAPILVADPPVPHAHDLLVLPGNRRVRVLDFRRGDTWTFVKPGFDLSANLNEAHARRGQGPFVNITDVAPDGRWMREPLLTGQSLPRLPPWQSRRVVEDQLVAALVSFSASTMRYCEPSDYHNNLRTRILEHAGVARSLHPKAPWSTLPALIDTLVAESGDSPISTSLSHGDLQAGNMFFRAGAPPLLIDWEYAEHRFIGYDLAVLDLQLRHARDLFTVLNPQAIREPKMPHVFHHYPELVDSASSRRAFAARVALEELLWLLQNAATPVLRALPERLRLALERPALWPNAPALRPRP